MTVSEWTALFGWMLLFNLVIYMWSAVMIIFARDFVVRMQSRIVGMEEAEWTRVYVDWLGRYKLLIIAFNLVPWLALKVVA